MSPKTRELNQKIELAILKGKRQKLLEKPDKTDLDRLELERIEQKLKRLENG